MDAVTERQCELLIKGFADGDAERILQHAIVKATKEFGGSDHQYWLGYAHALANIIELQGGHIPTQYVSGFWHWIAIQSYPVVGID